MDLRNWQLLSETDVSPSHWFPVFKQKVQLPNGRIVDDFFIAKMRNVSMILPVTARHEILFVKQYKHAAGEVLIELPAGMIDDLTPEETAIKELNEETGATAEKLIKICELSPQPTKLRMVINCFLAMDAKITSVQTFDENEEIEVLTIPISEVRQMVADGKIKASDTLAVLQVAAAKFPEIFQY